VNIDVVITDSDITYLTVLSKLLSRCLTRAKAWQEHPQTTPPLILQQNALRVKQRPLPMKEPDADWDGTLLSFLRSAAAV
jgi:hypothetical protein